MFSAPPLLDVPHLRSLETSTPVIDCCYHSAVAWLWNRLLRQLTWRTDNSQDSESHLFSWECDARSLLKSAAGVRDHILLT